MVKCHRNTCIAERYWSAQEARLFDTQQIETATRPYTGPTAAEAARIIAAIWQSQAPMQPPNQGQEQPG